MLREWTAMKVELDKVPGIPRARLYVQPPCCEGVLEAWADNASCWMDVNYLSVARLIWVIAKQAMPGRFQATT